jgi:hypothetical protein
MRAGVGAADGLGAEGSVGVFEADRNDLVNVVSGAAAEGDVVEAGDAVDAGVADGAGDFARTGGDALGEGRRGRCEQE